MAAQLNYTYEIPKGLPGGKFDIAPDVVNTRMNGEEDGVMKFGLAVFAGTTPGHDIVIPTAESTAEQFEGIVLHGHNTEQDMDGKVVIRNNASLSIMVKGHVWARLADEEFPTPGAKAYVVKSGENAGAFTATADGALDIGAIFGNAFDTGIAVVRL